MKERKHRPMFFIDISVPRNIDPLVNNIDNAYVYSIDDLQNVVEANFKERSKEARRADWKTAQTDPRRRCHAESIEVHK